MRDGRREGDRRRGGGIEEKAQLNIKIVPDCTRNQR